MSLNFQLQKSISITAAALEWEAKHWDVLDSLHYITDDDVVEIRVPKDLPAGAEVTILLDYTGRFEDDLEGFYRSKYKTADGRTHELAVTFLEPTCARQTASESKQLVVFQQSPLMSSYVCDNFVLQLSSHRSDPANLPSQWLQLVGLVAGHLSRVKSTKSRIPLSVLCPKGSEAQASFALELASDALGFFETLFDDQYPLPKLDLVAVPDFSSGAMENCGLITFRMNHLLIDTEDSSLDTKQAITRVVLHEIAHSWFGNLVTMKYWDGLWLKEGFATLLAWYASDKFFPGWHPWDKFITDTLQAALELDSLENSHPVEFVVKDATKAKQLFDHISYKKGCCVLKMLLDDLGEKRFFQGLKLYTHRHKFGNTESADLWHAFRDCGDPEVPNRMRVWTKETGFPVVTVTEEYNDANTDCGEVTALRLHQERFLMNRNSGSDRKRVFYPLHVSIRSESGVDTYHMPEQEIVITVRGKIFLKVNADHGVLFRTSYSSRHLQNLIQAAADGLLTLRDCIGLLADVSALTAAGINKTSELLDICLGFQFATEFSGGGEVLGSKARELGWEMPDDDDESQTAFKTSMFSAAGLVGDEE
ncbi:hypothetical protein CHGG_01142 [Chaetomium globosum CBS 148.51]|uniref:Uncharacterized protein n=1 Tax=Chaetomium globosum (strain ATCC 6205 / CBS 148.51 / DSM 1962 / NBRC 6347 / NRRL 1970) TaxID=306901 RepID=Q2HF62_CHAGB|nr:uncharacterized protein CHGG_01142 [Chaetomium globosum CBS 148.51]EAQ92907.1 hypothetical protein CHGG_01142 [Chaetomium globosum CBS 148.51]